MIDGVRGIWRLSRFQEFAAFVVITTLLGAAAGEGSLDRPLIVVLVANWLAVGFAFMVNDVEDAPDDALTPAKARRNPVSSGDLSPRFAWLASLAVAGLAAILYASLGVGPFVAGFACLVLAYLYSYRGVRLKATPYADLASHALLLAGLQFLAAYLTFNGGSVPQWVSPLVLVLAISLYGQLFNELRDLEGDRQGVTHTASVSACTAHWLMMLCCLAWPLVSILSYVCAAWILLTVVLAALFSWRRLPRVARAESAIELQGPFQKPVEIAAAIALLAWFAGAWAPSLVSVLAGAIR
jgi:4-hydroxybenzoate polyprenyltransferase